MKGCLIAGGNANSGGEDTNKTGFIEEHDQALPKTNNSLIHGNKQEVGNWNRVKKISNGGRPTPGFEIGSLDFIEFFIKGSQAKSDL
ncbi:MAG: hypothetical protein V4655_13305 [Bdellovibrionota bacterium]